MDSVKKKNLKTKLSNDNIQSFLSSSGASASNKKQTTKSSHIISFAATGLTSATQPKTLFSADGTSVDYELRSTDVVKEFDGCGRGIFVVRHGERVDFTFGQNWIKRCFDSKGNYVRFDLNMPREIPPRNNQLETFQNDSPLTSQGGYQARLLGESMRDARIHIDHVYSSPALRCVQTADSILSGLGIDKMISVEPGIFEWMAWHQDGLPSFMASEELTEAGFKINTTYKPVFNVLNFNLKETLFDYYDRCHQVTLALTRKHDIEGGNILLVSHKGSVDVCLRQLIGKNKLPLAAFRERVKKVPYCAVACCQQMEVPNGKWQMVSPGFTSSFIHGASCAYDWKIWI